MRNLYVVSPVDEIRQPHSKFVIRGPIARFIGELSQCVNSSLGHLINQRRIWVQRCM